MTLPVISPSEESLMDEIEEISAMLSATAKGGIKNERYRYIWVIVQNTFNRNGIGYYISELSKLGKPFSGNRIL